MMTIVFQAIDLSLDPQRLSFSSTSTSSRSSSRSSSFACFQQQQQQPLASLSLACSLSLSLFSDKAVLRHKRASSVPGKKKGALFTDVRRKTKKNVNSLSLLTDAPTRRPPNFFFLSMARSMASGNAPPPALLLLALFAAAACVITLPATVSAAVVVSKTPDGWIRGRATFFDASDDFRSSFEKIRGEGSFGDLHYGSCGYFNKPQVRRRFFFGTIVN